MHNRRTKASVREKQMAKTPRGLINVERCIFDLWRGQDPDPPEPPPSDLHAPAGDECISSVKSLVPLPLQQIICKYKIPPEYDFQEIQVSLHPDILISIL